MIRRNNKRKLITEKLNLELLNKISEFKKIFKDSADSLSRFTISATLYDDIKYFYQTIFTEIPKEIPLSLIVDYDNSLRYVTSIKTKRFVFKYYQCLMPELLIFESTAKKHFSTDKDFASQAMANNAILMIE